MAAAVDAKQVKQPPGLSGAVKLVVRTFLEQSHYRSLLRTLSTAWDGSHALSAAVRLMEAHGVKVSPEEEQKLSQMSEERMIDTLVTRMPQQSREQFDHFFLQLSLIASTTVRLRTALETGNAALIDEVLDAAENVGILNFIMKNAVTQAGQEVMGLEGNHNDWLRDTHAKLGPLIRGHGEASLARQDLIKAKTQLGTLSGGAKDKSRKAITSMLGGQALAALTNTFIAWVSFREMNLREKEVQKEYADQIAEVQGRLAEFKESQLVKVRSVLKAQAAVKDREVIVSCIAALKAEVSEFKNDELIKQQMEATQAKLQEMSRKSAANAKQVLTRMNGGADSESVAICFQAWATVYQEFSKAKEMDRAVKDAQGKVAQFMKKQKDGAKSVLGRMGASSDSGLVQSVFDEWLDLCKGTRKEESLKAAVSDAKYKISSFTTRNKANALATMKKLAQTQDWSLVIYLYNFWMFETKSEMTRKYGRAKNEQRKKKLLDVKGLFKSFANELEQGLKDGTPRIETMNKKGSSQ
eukprot:CAMPEP_0178410254 /NCGR_PEP_ID=MMETSP0689_2-20121128/20883_1 /TAXON_ID=160604 /ORGANISM="Amphidinium massartii, Strain CS-259" /LENGTH=524 /DNA_ID=CAMNT_0020031421 /DNA_START=136 /DNA_END=1707 /DNA_ORIENTATION=-